MENKFANPGRTSQKADPQLPQVSEGIQQDEPLARPLARPRQLPPIQMRLRLVHEELHTLRRTQAPQANPRRRSQLHLQTVQQEVPAQRPPEQAHVRPQQAGQSQLVGLAEQYAHGDGQLRRGCR